MVAYTFNLALKRQRYAEFCEFKINVMYIVGSRPAGDTQQESQKPKPTKQANRSGARKMVKYLRYLFLQRILICFPAQTWWFTMSIMPIPGDPTPFSDLLGYQKFM